MVFIKQGIAMLSSVLNSEKAIQIIIPNYTKVQIIPNQIQN